MADPQDEDVSRCSPHVKNKPEPETMPVLSFIFPYQDSVPARFESGLRSVPGCSNLVCVWCLRICAGFASGMSVACLPV